MALACQWMLTTSVSLNPFPTKSSLCSLIVHIHCSTPDRVLPWTQPLFFLYLQELWMCICDRRDKRGQMHLCGPSLVTKVTAGGQLGSTSTQRRPSRWALRLDSDRASVPTASHPPLPSQTLTSRRSVAFKNRGWLKPTLEGWSFPRGGGFWHGSIDQLSHWSPFSVTKWLPVWFYGSWLAEFLCCEEMINRLTGFARQTAWSSGCFESGTYQTQPRPNSRVGAVPESAVIWETG